MHACRVRARALAGLALVFAVAGCATRGTSVDHRMLLPQAGARHAVESTQFFVMPVSLAAPEPAFPETSGGAGAADVTVCAEIWLTADGDIGRVMPFEATPECAATGDPQARAYVDAVVEALRRWEFTPAMICEFPPELLARRDEGDCTGPEVAVRRVPVRLDYAFTFSSREGKRRVGFARRPAAEDAGLPAAR